MKNHPPLFFLIICLFVFTFNNSKAEDFSNYPDIESANYLLIVDQDSKEVLLEKNADVRIAPSSMTKLMTAYVVFEKIKSGKISLTNQCLIGRQAWKKGGSTMFLNYKDVVTIDELLTGLLVVSGNDAAVALSEVISGSDDDFAKLMNKTAKRIGLKNSNFKNPHGLTQDGHYMTLRDLATLAMRISSDFPEYLHYFTTSEFTYQKITQANRNPLLVKKYDGATGMKTGYTNKGGYGIVATANRDGRRLIAITNGAKTAKQREETIIQALDFAFDNYKKVTLVNKNSVVQETNIWLGDKDKIEMVSKEDIAITLPKETTMDDLKMVVNYEEEEIYAPIKKGNAIATLTIEFAGKKVKQVSLFAKENIDKATSLNKIWEMAKYKGHKFFTEVF
ncbi:MAG: D-alanyl-D-alanine carboxypeptidase [Proteobacteria bacterium]|nr:D-alanyl-D-alanine carboxypeptidase [Pseudomonadota bacterium]